MNLYLLSRDESAYEAFERETYDRLVVCAESEGEAREIHPEKGGFEDEFCRSWVVSPMYVVVELIGVADESVEKGVVLTSFNAG